MYIPEIKTDKWMKIKFTRGYEMKRYVTVLMIAALVLTMAFGSVSSAWADTPAAGELVVTGYTVTYTENGNPVSSITKNSKVDITLQLKHTGLKASVISDYEGNLDVSRKVDSFSGGTITNAVKSYGESPLMFETKISGLVYSGVGSSLNLMVGYSGDSRFDSVSVPIIQCEEYEEPVYEPYVPETPDPSPAPMALISRSEMPADMKANEERLITIFVKNVGSTTMTNPIVSFTTSDSLLLTGTGTSMQMKSIAPGKTESIDVPVKALGTISSVGQYIEVDMKFNYFNRVSTVEGSASGRVIIPCTVKTVEEPEDDGTGNPVPNLIITNFSYGGGSVAAGSAFSLNFDFVNTSQELTVENLVVTVEGGEGFTINGASNTVYFAEVEEEGTESVSLPMKALPAVTNGALPVTVNFQYEYVDQQKRVTASSSSKMTIPVYQPDRFELSSPNVPFMVFAGEETSVTMNYVNKGKSAVSNVEARLEGNVDTYTPVQNIGNLEAGKSGTIAFAVTAWEVPEAVFTIKITYEDANGDEKVREFPVTMTVEEMVFEDPGMYEPMPEPEPESAVNWKVIAAAAAAAAVIGFFVIRKRRKAARLKKETELWDSWDDDMGGSAADMSSGAADMGSDAADSGEASK